jgi:hypothetical protein
MTTNYMLEAPCSLYCGVCRMYQATQADDMAILQRLARFYARVAPELGVLQAEDLLCDGCLSDRNAVTCRVCFIRQCALERELTGCHECSDFPCSHIDQFPVEVGRKVIQRAVPFRRKHGSSAWVASETGRYQCPNCLAQLYRGVRNCPACRQEVNLD